MIQAAQTETATPDAEARAVAALQKSPPLPSFITVPRVAVAALAATTLLLVPLATPRSSGAWAQVAAATAAQARYHERISIGSKGMTTQSFDRWVDGKRYAFELGFGKSFGRFVNDGKRTYRHNPGSKYATVESSPNEEFTPYLAGFGSVKSLSIDEMLQGSNVRPVGEPQEKTLPEGKRTMYRVEYLTDPKDGKVEVSSTGNFYVVPGDSRIRRWELLDTKGEIVFWGTLDYPEDIPERLFKFEVPAGVTLYDLDAGKARIRQTLAKGFGTKRVGGQSVTLRAVMVGTNNDLTVLWTGAPPNGDLQPPIKVEGMPGLKPYGLTIMTTKVYRYVPAVEKLEYLPTSLGGMSVLSKTPMPSKVTVTIPVFAPDPKQPIYDFEGKKTGYRSRSVGSVTYRDVPVLRVGPFHSYLNALGLREPKRYEALVRDYAKKPKI
jgi:hypothetical protein